MSWQLWRQDDNGNRFLVEEFTSRGLAESRLSELTRNHHKQTYWMSETSAPRQTDATGNCSREGA